MQQPYPIHPSDGDSTAPLLEVRLMQADDAVALWALETSHRTYFEQWVNPRPDAFYTPQGFAQAQVKALAQQAAGEALHYLAWHGADLVGRINLTHIRRNAFHSASLGYRIAPGGSGQGIASRAVAHVLHEAFHTHGLQRMEATARPENPASIRVLLKNGFQQFGHSRRSIKLQGQWYDLLYFEAHAAPLHGT